MSSRDERGQDSQGRLRLTDLADDLAHIQNARRRCDQEHDRQDAAPDAEQRRDESQPGQRTHGYDSGVVDGDVRSIRVGEHTYRLILPEGDTGNCPLPDWAMRFVDYVDAGPDLWPVTAAEALELLERATSPRVWAQTRKEAEAFARTA